MNFHVFLFLFSPSVPLHPYLLCLLLSIRKKKRVDGTWGRSSLILVSDIISTLLRMSTSNTWLEIGAIVLSSVFVIVGGAFILIALRHCLSRRRRRSVRNAIPTPKIVRELYSHPSKTKLVSSLLSLDSLNSSIDARSLNRGDEHHLNIGGINSTPTGAGNKNEALVTPFIYPVCHNDV